MGVVGHIMHNTVAVEKKPLSVSDGVLVLVFEPKQV